MIKIAGAGIAGLTAAINLAKGDKEVEVHEKLSYAGAKIKPNIQILENWSVKNILHELKKVNISLPTTHPVKKIVIYSPSLIKATVIGKTKPIGYFIQRGGRKSFEYHLYKLAKKNGVKFVFNSSPSRADIIATGAKKVDAYGVGGVFEGIDMQKDTAEVFFDYKYCPYGYIYLIPHGKGKTTVMFGTFGKYKLWDYIEKAKKHHPILKEKFRGSKLLSKVYGFIKYGGPNFVNGKTLFIGEAAGFQDAMFGYGMKYAIFSGYFAACATLHGSDYNKLCNKSFGSEIRLHLLGNKFFKWFSNNLFWDKVVKNFGTRDVEYLGKLWSSKVEVLKFNLSMLTKR